jgi:hypothetical protein
MASFPQATTLGSTKNPKPIGCLLQYDGAAAVVQWRECGRSDERYAMSLHHHPSDSGMRCPSTCSSHCKARFNRIKFSRLKRTRRKAWGVGGSRSLQAALAPAATALVVAVLALAATALVVAPTRKASEAQAWV